MSHYDTMGLQTSASDVEIRNRYRELARIVHPDAGGDPYQFRILNDAYATLGQPTTRAAYDQRLKRPAAQGSSDSSSAADSKAAPGEDRLLAQGIEGLTLLILTALLVAVCGVVANVSARSFTELEIVATVCLALLMAYVRVLRPWQKRRSS